MENFIYCAVHSKGFSSMYHDAYHKFWRTCYSKIIPQMGTVPFENIPETIIAPQIMFIFKWNSHVINMYFLLSFKVARLHNSKLVLTD